MANSRRAFLRSAASKAFASVAALPTLADSSWSPSPNDIVDLFKPLPGDKGVKIFVHGKDGGQAFSAELNSGQMLFVASAIKTFVLCEALRQVDSPDVVHTLESKELTLNSTVWSFGSPAVFNPPNLEGMVSERVTMEAMIMNSDNTATDIVPPENSVDPTAKSYRQASPRLNQLAACLSW